MLDLFKKTLDFSHLNFKFESKNNKTFSLKKNVNKDNKVYDKSKKII